MTDIEGLRALREAGRHGSIASAAAALGISQQALSARMRTLERAMGLQLLVRTHAGSRLTEQGALVLGWAEDVLVAADRLEAGVRSIRSGIARRLAIAASQTTAEHLVPHWLIELRAAEEAAGMQPTVVELTVSNSTGVIERVRDDAVNMGVIETPHLPPDLVRAHLRDDELLVVTAPAHPWARLRRPLTPNDLAATPLAMRESGSGTRDTLTDHLAAQDPPLRAVTPAVELGTSAAVRSAIAAGVAPGVLSRLAVRDDLVLGRLVAVELAGPPLTRVFTAVWRYDRPLPPEGQRLLAVAQGKAVVSLGHGVVRAAASSGRGVVRAAASSGVAGRHGLGLSGFSLFQLIPVFAMLYHQDVEASGIGPGTTSRRQAFLFATCRNLDLGSESCT